MRWSVLAVVFLGVVAAGCAAVLVAALQKGTQGETLPAEVDVVMAAVDLQTQTVIQSEHVTTKTVAREEAPPDYKSDPIQVIGKVLKVDITEGQAITKNELLTDGSPLALAVALKDGMRAYSVSLADHSGLLGVLYPGSLVDVLASFRMRGSSAQDAVSVTLMRGIRVLGIENQTVVSPTAKDDEQTNVLQGSSAPNRRFRITLMVNAEQAQALQLAMEHGKLSLAMRNPMDDTAVKDTAPTVLSRIAGTGAAQAGGLVGPAYNAAVSALSAAGADPSQLRRLMNGNSGAADQPNGEAPPGEETDEDGWDMQVIKDGVLERVFFPKSAAVTPAKSTPIVRN